MLPGLDQYLDGHVVGDMPPLNELPADFIFRLGGGGEADLDLFDAYVHQRVEILQLFVQIHGVYQGLVAVPQVHGAPHRGLVNDLVRPGPAHDLLGLEGDVLLITGSHNKFLLDVWGRKNAPDFLQSGAWKRVTRYHPGSAGGRPSSPQDL